MRWSMDEWMQKLKFDEEGLIPAIVQDYVTHEALGLAYMNKESLRLTLDQKRPCFYSRSQKCLWRKGERTGDIQQVMAVSTDPDGDALVVQVKKSGTAHDTDAAGCFVSDLYEGEEYKPLSLWELMSLVQERGVQPPESFTAGPFTRENLLAGLAAESAGLLAAGAAYDRGKALQRIGGLVCQGLALMTHLGISPEEVSQELNRRYPPEQKMH